MSNRIICWFSCGAASAISTKLAIEKYGNLCEIYYCDTGSEHFDNERFLKDCEKWFGMKINILKSDKYKDIWEVFERTRYLVGIAGARCTTELKKVLRLKMQEPDDLHIFGFTYDESNRIQRFVNNNPDIKAEWNLANDGINKQDCFELLEKDTIEIPEMYKMGYKNNNCIGCVKGGAGYWNKIRVDFPGVFDRMSKVERKLNVAINKKYIDGKRTKVFLDALPKNAGRYKSEYQLKCDLHC